MNMNGKKWKGLTPLIHICPLGKHNQVVITSFIHSNSYKCIKHTNEKYYKGDCLLRFVAPCWAETTMY